MGMKMDVVQEHRIAELLFCFLFENLLNKNGFFTNKLFYEY